MLSIIIRQIESLAKREKRNAYMREYYAKNKERIKGHKAKWVKNNQDKVKEINKRYYKNNRDKANEAHRKWVANNKERAKELQDLAVKNFHLRNPEYSKNQVHNRRAKYRATGFVSEKQWLNLVEQFDSTCAYCGVYDEKLTIDHVIPISQGGKHKIDNILPACVSCNCSKKDKNMLVWMFNKCWR